MFWKLNKWKYVVFFMWTLINIKQNKEVIKISDTKYDPHNAETETFTLFTGLTKPYIQSTSGIE